MSIQLFGKQQTIVDDITVSFENYMKATEKSVLCNAAYISGEMGVGKTFMGTKILSNMKKSGKMSLVVAPASTTKKWQKILNEELHSNIVIFDPKAKELDTAVDVLILRNKDLTPFLKLMAAADEQNQPKFDFVIVDEVHTLKPGTVPFKNVEKLREKYAQRLDVPLLLLTGTVFSQSTKNLLKLIKMTHPTYYQFHNSPELISGGHTNLPKFMYYWQVISWSIALKDVESEFNSDSKDDIIQEIAPIQLIQPTAEQLAVYKLAEAQLKQNNVSAPGQKATSILDLPSQSSNLTRTRVSKGPVPSIDGGPRYIEREFNVGFTVKDITFKNTPKYKELVGILEAKSEKTLIFVNDEPLIKQLAEQLTEDGYKVGTMPKSIKAHDYSNHINEELTNNVDLFIINPMKISTGVDITSASRIVWYQLLSDLGSTLQAQRRVYRLSSTKSSTIHFLAYAKTYQEVLITEISESAKNNAVSYGENDTSNLAKLTGLLFGQ